MNRRGLTAFALFACFGLVAAGFALAAEEKKAGAPEGELTPEMERMMKLAQPGEHHKHLGDAVGSWDYTLKQWADPSQPPTEMKGTAEGKWTLGGRFVETVYKGEFQGMPFEGHGLDGYDNQAQKYTGTWVDNMGTLLIVSSGSCDKGGKVRTMKSEFLDPMTGKDTKFKTVGTTLDKDHLKFEAWSSTGGPEMKVMEIQLVRR